MKNYVALYHSGAVRDTQICKLDQKAIEAASGDAWNDEYWEDVEGAEVFIGIFAAETEQDAIARAARQEGCAESSIRAVAAGYPEPAA